MGRLDGELWLRWRECVIPLRECRESEVGAHRGTTDAVDKPASKARTQKTPAQRTAKRKSRCMDGFSIRDPAPRRPPSPATPVALRAPSAADDTS